MSEEEELGWRCVNDLVYQSNAKDRNAAYTRLASVYDIHMENVGAVANENLVKVAFEFVKNDESSLMLDVAAGTGKTAKYFKDSGYVGQTDGIDVNAEMLDIAIRTGLYRKTYSQEIVDHSPLPVPDNTYDIAAVVGAFLENHLPTGCIPYIVRALKPGGLMIFNCRITEHNKKYLGKLMGIIDSLIDDSKMELVKKKEICFSRSNSKEDGKPIKGWAFVYRKL